MPRDQISECLHCDINDLVQQRIEATGGSDLVEIAAMMMESLADLILLAPERDRPKLMAEGLAHFGHALLEKTGTAAESSTATH